VDETMTRTSAAAYMASNCSFAPTGPDRQSRYAVHPCAREETLAKTAAQSGSPPHCRWRTRMPWSNTWRRG